MLNVKTQFPQIGPMGPQAQKGLKSLANASLERRSFAIQQAAKYIRDRLQAILDVNAVDCATATQRNVTASFLDRMHLDRDKLQSIAASLEEIAHQEDPFAANIDQRTRPNGLVIERVRVPIGVIGIIYESRPNVTTDAAAICLMSRNAVILRSGSDCLPTAKILHLCIVDGLKDAEISPYAVQLVQTSDRAAVGEMLSGLGGTIDLIIPRGGKSLVGRVQSEARVPTLSHLDGNCHVYVDGAANTDKAIDIVLNSKMRRTGVCGAAETLLVDAGIAATFLPQIVASLEAAGCDVRADAPARSILPSIRAATRQDFETEYLAPIISIAVVEGVDAALSHIATYSSGHTDAIVTEDMTAARRFITEVDSAIVLLNASTQFADGGEFGLGAEIGISTGKLHARGPVGVKELTTYKNVVWGAGQIRP